MSSSSSFGYQVLYRSGRGNGEDGAADEVELKPVILDGELDMESESEGERVDDGKGRRPEDSRSLIGEEPEISDAGEARDYEVALKHAGFGLFHVALVCMNGVALASDAVELLSLAFVLPILQREGFSSSDAQNAVLSSVIFIGMLCGSYTWGGFADILGRKFVLIVALTVNGIFGAVSAFSPNITVFIFCRFFSGVGVGGSLPVLFPYIAEFTLNKYRGTYMSIQAFFWTMGRLVSGGVAWVVLPLSLGAFHSWRLYILLSSLPAFCGALLYLFLPESPRYLLEHGKREKALRNLRLVHTINHLHRRKSQFLIKSIRVEAVHANDEGGVAKTRWDRTKRHVRQLLSHTRELYNKTYCRRTVLMSTILFTLSFGSYGVLLWYPSYVQEVRDSERQTETARFCHHSPPSNVSLYDYCGCDRSSFTDQHFTNTHFSQFKLSHSNFHGVKFSNVTFTNSVIEDSNFTNCSLENVRFGEKMRLIRVRWYHTVFTGVNVTGLISCGGEVKGGGGGEGGSGGGGEWGELVMALEGGNASCGEEGEEVKCEKEEDEESVYRDLFFVAASATVGNIASAIGVYYMRRNYWMAISMFASTASVFLLYAAQTEVFVVVVLCLFTALSTPAWNDSGLLNSDLYPTHLRSSSQGMHLLFARIGAILGTNIFGLFIHVNPAVPILLTACMLTVGSVAALPLPKTTRKTLLQ